MITPIPSSAPSMDAHARLSSLRPPHDAPATPDWSSPEARALELLEKLGRADHPDAHVDPVYALYQVAVDFQCSAHGYRELYLHRMHA